MQRCNGGDDHQWLEDKVQQQLPLLSAKTISCTFSLLLSELNLPKSPPHSHTWLLFECTFSTPATALPSPNRTERQGTFSGPS